MKQSTKSKTPVPEKSSGRGRKRDETLDSEILEVALQILGEVGYEGMTLSLVASRAKAGKGAMYRRWDSKAELVLDALQMLSGSDLDFAALPDTGTLRGDILSLLKPKTIKIADQKIKILRGVVAMISQRPEFAEAAYTTFFKPWITVNLELMKRARDRGEVSKNADIESAAQVIPTNTMYRALILGQALDLAHLTRLLDGVVLPAVLKRQLKKSPTI